MKLIFLWTSSAVKLFVLFDIWHFTHNILKCLFYLVNTFSEYLLFANTQVLDLYVHEHVYMTFGYLQIQFKAQNMGVCIQGSGVCIQEEDPHGILWDSVNKWVVCILLECILIRGRERLIQSHSSARFCFELSGNSN